METDSTPEIPVPVEVCELGPIGVREGDRWVPARGDRTKSVLAALSFGRHTFLSTETLVDQVWPTTDQPTSARHSLANVISRLRSHHGDDFIVTSAAGYRLGHHVRSDRERFEIEINQAKQALAQDPADALEIAEQAVRRWRGEPWAGMDSPDDVLADRARLLGLKIEARRIRALALVSLARHSEAIHLLEEHVAIRPLDEAAWTALARARAEGGHRIEALRALRAARNALTASGLTLGAAASELEHWLLAGSEAPASDGYAELPHEPTALLGRDPFIEEILDLVESHEVVTLFGPAGVGKTRVANEVARRCVGRSCSFIDLSPVRDAEVVPEMITAALGIGVPLGTDPLDALVAALRPSAGLLVFDNCEQVAEAMAQVVSRLGERCPDIRILATSRELLGVPAERVATVEPLDTAADGAGVALFFERARRAGVELNVDAWGAIVSELCASLDGLPLCIELAAGRAGVLSPNEIRDGLDDRFALLRGGRADDRRTNLHQAIEWSWELLDAQEQRALCHLSVFPSGAGLDAASHVLGLDRWATIEMAQQLSSKSLLNVTQHPDRQTRLELLDTVRFFVLDAADRSGVLDRCRDAHLVWVDEYTAGVMGQHGTAQRVGNPLALLDLERHEIRAGLDHAISSGHNADRAVHICVRAYQWWRGRTTAGEAVARVKALLEVAELTVIDRVEAIVSIASLSRISDAGDDRVTALVAEAYELLSQIVDPDDRDRLEIRLLEAEFDDTNPDLEHRLRRLTRTTNECLTALHLLTAWMIANRPAEAPAVAAELAETSDEHTDSTRAHARELQGLAAVAAGDLDTAREHLSDAMDVYDEIDQTFCTVHCCESIAWLTAEEGDLDTARRLLAQAEGVRRIHSRTRAGFEMQAIDGARRLLSTLPDPDHDAEVRATIADATAVLDALGADAR